jgi:putative PEP-CTERM system integral membrane protein
MARHADQVADALAQLEEAAGVGAALDVYLTASTYRGEGPYQVALSVLDPQEILYFGGQNAAELLAQFEALRTDQTYDAVLVFTDGSGYELGESDVTVPIPPAPVWMIHLGSDIPLGYDDETLEAIQASGGGVVGELGQALTRLAVASTAGDSGGEMQRDVVDGYLWSVLPTNQAAAILDQADPKDDFIAFAARRMILAEMQRQGGKLSEPETLDRLHVLAQDYHIVTPYSSMIVLVTDEQQQILDHLAQGDDRFEREFETLTDTTPSTPLPLAGVPEPHEWLLIGTAVAMLVWYVSKNRLILQRRGVRSSHVQ